MTDIADTIISIVITLVLFVLGFVVAYIMGKTSQADERYETTKRFNEWLKERRKKK